MQFMIELIICSILITYSINHNFARSRIDSYGSLPLTFHVIMLMKSVVNKNENNYCYNIFLEKGSNEDKCNTYLF